MPRKQIDRRLALLFVMSSAIAAFLPAILKMAVHGSVSLPEVARRFGPNLVVSLSIGGLAWLILPRWGSCITGGRFPLNWFRLVATLLAIAAAGLLLGSSLLSAAGYFPGRFWPAYLESLRLACVITLMIGVSVSVYEQLKHRLERTTRELESKRQEAEQERQTAVAARLASLESRIHPHFLFNTLNSISALIREDPARAERLVERLAALLRFSLDSNQNSLTTLRTELKIVTDYLEIERARFGERLSYSVDVPDTLLDVEVPGMSVQTLVENSVKHAISPRREGGRIQVVARASGGAIEITVSDDGPGFSESGFAAGHGLETLQSRLAAHFAERGQLTVARGSSGGAVVSLILPAAGGRA